MKLMKFIDYINIPYSKRRASKIMEYDWDYLIILDACRYDMFTWVINKQVPFVISGGSTTQEWIEWNFNGQFNDVICIGGNPRLSSFNLRKSFGKIPFYKVVEVWDFGWDKNLLTVPPKEVIKATLKTLKEYPNKRMLIHFNQPHSPFLADLDLFAITKGNPQREILTIWNEVKEGKFSIKRVWRAYLKNLILVMNDVYKLVEELTGKVVISSDHGNLLGEYFRFGHIPHLRVKNLVKVPWYVIKDEKKEEIFADMDNFEVKLSNEGILETGLIKEKIRKFTEEHKL